MQRISLNTNKKMKEVDEAMILFTPHHVMPFFFKTGNVGVHQNIYVKESPVSQHGVRGLRKIYKPK